MSGIDITPKTQIGDLLIRIQSDEDGRRVASVQGNPGHILVVKYNFVRSSAGERQPQALRRNRLRLLPADIGFKRSTSGVHDDAISKTAHCNQVLGLEPAHLRHIAGFGDDGERENLAGGPLQGDYVLHSIRGKLEVLKCATLQDCFVAAVDKKFSRLCRRSEGQPQWFRIERKIPGAICSLSQLVIGDISGTRNNDVVSGARRKVHRSGLRVSIYPYDRVGRSYVDGYRYRACDWGGARLLGGRSISKRRDDHGRSNQNQERGDDAYVEPNAWIRENSLFEALPAGWCESAGRWLTCVA